MKKRKRAPGGGRKPKRGPLRTAPQSVRLSQRLRVQLAAAVRKKRDSNISREIIRRLTDSFADDRKRRLGAPRNSRLGDIIARHAAHIELTTGKSWRTDAFTAQALAVAIQFALQRLSPGGTVKVPARVEQSASNMDRVDPQLDKQYRKPEGVGFAVAAGFWQQLTTLNPPIDDPPKNAHYVDDFYDMRRWRADLGLPEPPNEGVDL
jgi:hypothetical protein